jgi:hypothetical protein
LAQTASFNSPSSRTDSAGEAIATAPIVRAGPRGSDEAVPAVDFAGRDGSSCARAASPAEKITASKRPEVHNRCMTGALVKKAVTIRVLN